jgi:ABC-type sugar transport system ATPase subunit
MPGVQIASLAKRFGETSVIEGLDLAVQDHEFMVLVGPSGCGKSTVLRMVAGLEETSGGTISIGDRVVMSEIEEQHKMLAYECTPDGTAKKKAALKMVRK